MDSLEDSLFNHRISVLLNYPFGKSYYLIERRAELSSFGSHQEITKPCGNSQLTLWFPLFMISIVTLCTFFKMVRFLKQDARGDISLNKDAGSSCVLQRKK